MTMSLAKLSNPEFVCNELLVGSPGSKRDEDLRRALDVRKLLEDMKATRASRRIGWLALIVAVGSVIVSTVLR